MYFQSILKYLLFTSDTLMTFAIRFYVRKLEKFNEFKMFTIIVWDKTEIFKWYDLFE